MERFLDRLQATPEKSSSEVLTTDTPTREIKISGRPIPEEILDDLCSRFLLNIPATERDDMVRLMFQIELAHWFYIDFHRVEDPTLPEMKLPQFSGKVKKSTEFALPSFFRMSLNFWSFHTTELDKR